MIERTRTLSLWANRPRRTQLGLVGVAFLIGACGGRRRVCEQAVANVWRANIPAEVDAFLTAIGTGGLARSADTLRPLSPEEATEWLTRRCVEDFRDAAVITCFADAGTACDRLATPVKP